MKKIDWKDAAELIGIAAIFVSLVFLALQIRQQQLAADAEAVAATAANLTELTQAINEHRSIWIKGLKGEELSEADESIFYGLMWATWRNRVAEIDRAERLTVGDAGRYAERFAFEIYTYPGLRRWFEDIGVKVNGQRTTFDREATDPGNTAYGAVQQKLAEIDRRSPQIPWKKSYDIE